MKINAGLKTQSAYWGLWLVVFLLTLGVSWVWPIYDLEFFAIVSAPFSALLSSLVIVRATSKLSSWADIGVGLAAGLGVAFLWTYAIMALVSLSLPPIGLTVTVPFFHVWLFICLVVSVFGPHIVRHYLRLDESEKVIRRNWAWVFPLQVGVLTAGLWLVLSGAATDLLAFRTDEVYLLPADYAGLVVVVFEQSDGSAYRVEDGASVFAIPENGVLRISESRRVFRGRQFWYVNDASERITRLDWIPRCNDLVAGDPVVVCILPMLTIVNGRQTPEYVAYYVGRRNERGSLSDDALRLRNILISFSSASPLFSVSQ